MPFKSEAQRKFLFARLPKVAEEFAEHTPKGKKLPKKIKKMNTVKKTSKTKKKLTSGKTRRKKD